VPRLTDFGQSGTQQVLTLDQFGAALMDKIANHIEQQFR
jgi:hypothetical protein